MQAFVLAKLEFGDVVFCRGRKTREPEEKPSGQRENYQTHIGGKQVLSPQRHSCPIPDPVSVSSRLFAKTKKMTTKFYLNPV